MAVLNIRNLPEEIRRRLRIRAAEAGRSMEAEARSILAAACGIGNDRAPASSLPDWVQALYGRRKPRGVADGLISDRKKEGRAE